MPPAAAAAQRAVSAAAFSGGPQPEWWESSLQANFAGPHTRATWQAEAAALGRGAFRAGEVGVPTLVVHGDDDRLAPPAIGEYVHRKIPGSRLEVVDGGSHMLPITHADALADRIVAF